MGSKGMGFTMGAKRHDQRKGQDTSFKKIQNRKPTNQLNHKSLLVYGHYLLNILLLPRNPRDTNELDINTTDWAELYR